MTGFEKPSAVEPHPVLPAYYERRSDRSTFIRALFNDTAAHYDRINGIFSLGSGAFHRNRCLRLAGLRPGLHVLDVAIGTGLVAREAIAITGSKANVIGLDLSEAMLAEAQRNLDISLIQGTAESLPIADHSVDFVTMGYALRHVSDLVTTFREFYRVLRPGGTVLLLEISRPGNALKRAFVSFYLGRVIPFVCRWTTGETRARTLMEYYWDTIENCVSPSVILRAMTESGFDPATSEAQFDLFRSYIGRKP